MEDAMEKDALEERFEEVFMEKTSGLTDTDAEAAKHFIEEEEDGPGG